MYTDFAAAEFPRHRVLLVDDNKMIQEAFRHLLMDQFPAAILTSARSIHEAQDILQAAVFLIAFLDHHLPDGEGHELLERFVLPPHADTLVVDFRGGCLIQDESVPFFKRIDGQLKKTDLADGLILWLVQAGLLQEPCGDPFSEQALDLERLRQMAQEELSKESHKLGLLICRDDAQAIAAQAHCLVGLAGLLQQKDLSQVCETIYEMASLGKLAAVRQAWQFFQRLIDRVAIGS